MHGLYTQRGMQGTLSFEVFDKPISLRHAAHSFRQNDMRSFLGIQYVIYSLRRTLAVVYFRYHIVSILAGGVESGVLPQMRMIRILVPLPPLRTFTALPTNLLSERLRHKNVIAVDSVESVETKTRGKKKTLYIHLIIFNKFNSSFSDFPG